jgi:hypothetical protein
MESHSKFHGSSHHQPGINMYKLNHHNLWSMDFPMGTKKWISIGKIHNGWYGNMRFFVAKPEDILMSHWNRMENSHGKSSPNLRSTCNYLATSLIFTGINEGKNHTKDGIGLWNIFWSFLQSFFLLKTVISCNFGMIKRQSHWKCDLLFSSSLFMDEYEW